MSDSEDSTHLDRRDPPAATAATCIMPLTMPYYFGAPWLPSYAGEPHSLREFRDKMLATFKLYPVSQDQKVEILIGQLQGAALREVKSWPRSERKTAEQILDRLNTTFETRTASELKMCFFGKWQQPKVTLRDFALSLQEALRAVIHIDPREAEGQDQTLREQFIEGVLDKSLKRQLKMLSAQHPNTPFLDFKELAIDILGERHQSEPPEDKRVGPAPRPATHSQMTEHGAQAPVPDAVATLTAQVSLLAETMERMRKQLERLEHQPKVEKGTSATRDRPTPGP